MEPKPDLYASHYAVVFRDPRVIAAYAYRPPYNQAAIEFLAQLAADQPRRVLDVGCGPGDVARRLAPLVDEVDAVDVSAGMIEAGRRLPGGAAPNLRWTVSSVEDVPLTSKYALVTAGESLHWMEWNVVLPRFAKVLSPNGVVALVGRDWDGSPAVRQRLLPLFKHFVAVAERRGKTSSWQNVNLVMELESRKLFSVLGRRDFNAEPWTPTVEEYLECRHSQRSFAHSALGTTSAAEFDAELRQALEELCAAGEIRYVADRLHFSVKTSVVWGVPNG